MNMKWILTATICAFLASMIPLTAHELVWDGTGGPGGAAAVLVHSGTNGDLFDSDTTVNFNSAAEYDAGQTVRLVYTPTATDLAVATGNRFVNLYEIGGTSNGSVLSLYNGRIQWHVKMNSVNNDCTVDPATAGDQWLNNVAPAGAAEHIIALSNPEPIVVGMSYIITVMHDSAGGVATIWVNNTMSMVTGPGQSNRNWGGDETIGWGTWNGGVGGIPGNNACPIPYINNNNNRTAADGTVCGSLYNGLPASVVPCDLDGLDLEKTAPFTASAGETIVFDITLDNNTGASVGSVCLSDTLPPGMVFDTPAHNFNTAVGVDAMGNPVIVPVTVTVIGGTQITWKVGSTNNPVFLPDGAGYQIQVFAVVDNSSTSCGQNINQVAATALAGVTEEGTGCTVAIDTGVTLSNEVEFTIQCPDLIVTKTVTNLTSGGSMMAVPGDVLEYCVTVDNLVNGQAFGVQLVDMWDPNLTAVPGSLSLPPSATLVNMTATSIVVDLGTVGPTLNSFGEGDAVAFGGITNNVVITPCPTSPPVAFPVPGICDPAVPLLGDGATLELDGYIFDVSTGGNGDFNIDDIGIDGGLLLRCPIGHIAVDDNEVIDYRNDTDFLVGDEGLMTSGFRFPTFDGLPGLAQNDNYATMFIGDINFPDQNGDGSAYNVELGTDRSDDPMQWYIDFDGSGKFEANAGDGENGERVLSRNCCGNRYITTAVTPGSYRFMVVHIERGGGSQVAPTVDLNDGNGRRILQPGSMGGLVTKNDFFRNYDCGPEECPCPANTGVAGITLPQDETAPTQVFSNPFALDGYAFSVLGAGGDANIDEIGQGGGLLTQQPISHILFEGMDRIHYQNDGNFRNGRAGQSPGFATSLDGLPGLNQNDNFATMFVGDLNIPDKNCDGLPYAIELGTQRSDDPMQWYVDLDQDGAFQAPVGDAEGQVPGVNERVVSRNCCGNRFVTFNIAPGTYQFMVVHVEGGGGSQVEPTINLFDPDTINGRATVGPGVMNGIFTRNDFAFGAYTPDPNLPAVQIATNMGTYSVEIPACPDLESWEILDLNMELPGGTEIQVAVSNAAGTTVATNFLPGTSSGNVDISSFPNTDTTLFATFTLISDCKDPCVVPVLDNWNVMSFCSTITNKISFQATVGPCITPGLTSVVNQAAATSDVADLDPSNDIAEVVTELKSWDLCLGKAGFVDVLPPRRAPFPPLPTVVTNCATSVVYVITVTNIGNADAPNAMVIDDLPVGLSFVSGAGCTATGQTVYCSIGTLAAGAVTSAVIVTEVADCLTGDFVNTARAMPMCGDFNPSNNAVTVTNTVIPDTAPPAFTSLPPDLNVCNQDLAPLLVDPTTDETCVGSLTTTTVSSVTGCILRVERTFELIDLCGLSTAHTQVIEINIDTNAPFLTVPPNEFVCNTPVTDMMFTDVVVTDDCILAAGASFTAVTTPLVFCPGELITRTWTATDGCGNQTVAIQLITNSFDSAPPVVTAMDMDGCNLDTSVAALGMATVDDANCAFTLSWTDTVATVGCGDVISRTWIAVDACGNTGMVVQTISNVVDTTPPSLTIPADTNGCGISTAIADTGTATATDLCSTMLTITNTDVVLLQGGNEIIFRTWEATDACGNVASDVQLIVNSTNFTGPALMLPPDTNACNGADQPAATGMAMVIDTCCGTSTLVFVDNMLVGAGSCGGDLIERIWTASDSCGSISLTQLIDSVADVTPPMLVLPADTNLCNATDTSVAALGSATATDDCILISTTWTDTVPNSACGDEISRVWTATDACGNVASATQLIVNLIDTDAPVLTIPADETGCNLAVSTNMATAVDACSSATVWFVDAAATQDCVVVISRTWYAADICGNQTSAVQNIASTEDTTAPMISVSDVSGCDVLASAAPASATDACALATLTSTDTVAIVGCTTLVTRVWTAVDDCGNMSSATQTIESITDAGAPLITFVPADSVECGGGDTSPATLGMTTATGGCAVVVTWSDAVLTTPCGDTISRTWVAADECGNSTSAVQVIQVLTDGVAPILQIPADAELCSALDDPGTAVATDGCGAITLTSSDVTTVITCGVSVATQILRTWTATDLCGNVASDDQIILVSNGEAPVISSVPTNTTGCFLDIASLPQATAEGCLAITTDLIETTVNSGCVQVVTREWTFANACGSTSAVQIVNNILDVDAPQLVVPSDMEGCQLDLTNVGMAVAFDSCSGVSVGFTDQVTPFDCGVSIVRTWTATDGCGNNSDGVQNIISYTNGVSPVITVAPADISGCNIDVSSLPVAEALGCVDLFTAFFESSTNDGCVVTTTRSWTFSQGCGSTSHVQVIVSTDDTLAPVLALPADVSDCNLADTSPAALGMATASDVCGNVTVSWTDVSSIAGCEETIVRTWTAEDDCGNTASADQTIVNRTDAEAPMITAPADVRLCNINGAITPGMATVNDNCGTATVTFVDAVAQIGCEFTITRTWTATDPCGNSATASQTIITETDPEAPALTMPADTVVCDPADSNPLVTGFAVSTDNCSSSTVDFSDSTVVLGCATVITRTWTAVDRCGLTNAYEQIITVFNDTDAPEITVADETFCMLSTNAVTPADAVVTDGCSSANVSLVESSSILVCDETLTRVWTATDECGNQSVVTQIVTITRDTTFSFTIPADADGCNLDTSTAGTGEASLTSDCPLAAPTFIDTTATTSCGQSIIRTWSAQDVCGVLYTGTQLITTVIDTDAPVIDLADASGCNIGTSVADVGMPVVTDNCDTPTLVNDDSVTTQDCVLVITRVWTATDGCGNSSAATQTIMSTIDTDGPVITVANVSGCGVLATAPAATATDDCGGAALSSSDELVQVGCIQTVTRTWTAQDDCGNISTAVQTIENILDAGAPVFVDVPEDLTGCNLLITNPTVFATATDDCGDPDITFSDTSSQAGCVVTILREWTATDVCGNVATSIQTFVNTIDAEAPVITIPADVSGCNVSSAASPAGSGLATATDNCNATVTFADMLAPSNPASCETFILRTWTATDDCGNSSSGIQRITIINDNTPPVMDCPTATAIFPDAAGNFTVPNLVPMASATDDCPGGVTITQAPAPGSVFGSTFPATASIVVTSRDACGNEAQCMVQITSASCIAGIAFDDFNSNGIQDSAAGDGPTAGVEVILYDVNDTEVARTSTRADGSYIFFMDPADPSTAVARGTQSGASFTLGLGPNEAAPTSLIDPATGRSAPIVLMTGEHRLNQDIGISKSGTIQGFIWNDIANTGDPRGANLVELGFNGANVTLLRLEPDGSSSVVATTTTATDDMGNMGAYSFDGLPPGDYQVTLDPDSLPDNLGATPTLTSDPLGLGAGQTLLNGTNFPLMFGSGPTAIELVSLDATGGSIIWTTADESDVLGYNIIDLATGEAVNDALILANGNGGSYELVVGQGSYALESVDTALGTSRDAEATHYQEVDASPQGEPTDVVEAEGGQASFTTREGTLSYLVTGVASGISVLDVSDPDNPVRLLVELLQTDTGNAVYFSHPAGATIEVR